MLTWDLPEDNIAHEFLKSVCVESRSVYRYSVLQKMTRVLHVFLAQKRIYVLTFLPHREPELSMSVQVSLLICETTPNIECVKANKYYK